MKACWNGANRIKIVNTGRYGDYGQGILRYKCGIFNLKCATVEFGRLKFKLNKI